MKLLFSEAQPDYAHYIFPYAVWAFPEAGETAADFFDRGFLPSSRELDRFYLCRHTRVSLAGFVPSSENRRILRKGAGLKAVLIPRAAFAFTAERREFCRRYADQKFGPGVMSVERLESLFNSPITSHLLVFLDAATGAEVGIVTLYLESNRLAFYYYAFYDLAWSHRKLGMFMMTFAVDYFAQQAFQFVYLGSCYSENALYKAQFRGFAFFNGVRWSENLEELKALIRRGQTAQTQHLLEDREYRQAFYGADPKAIASESLFLVPVSKGTCHPD